MISSTCKIFTLLLAISGCSNARPLTQVHKNKRNTDNSKEISTLLEAMAKDYKELADLKNPKNEEYPRVDSSEAPFEMEFRSDSWTDGFFSGTLDMLQKATNDPDLEGVAQEWAPAGAADRTDTHDLGFIIFNSFGRFDDEKSKTIVEESASGLASRFSETVGCIKSWDWGSGSKWNYPVIIDSVMNLEMLLHVGKYNDIVKSHLDHTMKNHFEKIGSNGLRSYHVVDYDSETGKVIKKVTYQGLGDSTSWARGQSWAVYGYATAYMYLKDEKYLNVAKKVLNHIKADSDLVPFWDFNANDKDAPDLVTMRLTELSADDFPKGTKPYRNMKGTKSSDKIFTDTSASAVLASALRILEHVDSKNKSSYSSLRKNIIKALLANHVDSGKGTFALKNSAGNVPQAKELDVRIVYGDYYLVEALTGDRIFL